MHLQTIDLNNIAPVDPRWQGPPHVTIVMALDPDEARLLWTQSRERLLTAVADRVASQPAADRAAVEAELAALVAERRQLAERRAAISGTMERLGANAPRMEALLLGQQLEVLIAEDEDLAGRERGLRHRLTAIDGSLADVVRRAVEAERAAVARAGAQLAADLEASLQARGELFRATALRDALAAADLPPLVEAVRVRLSSLAAPAVESIPADAVPVVG